LTISSISWLSVDSVKWKGLALVVRQRCSRGRNHSRRIHAHSWHFPQTSSHSVRGTDWFYTPCI